MVAVLGQREVFFEHPFPQLVHGVAAVLLARHLAEPDQLGFGGGDLLSDLRGRQVQLARFLLHPAGLFGQLQLHLQDGLDALLVPEPDGLQHVGFRDLGGPDFNHVDPVAVTRQHQVQVGELHLGGGRVEHEALAFVGNDAADADGGHRPLERRVGQAQRRRRSVARQHVRVVLAVMAHHPRLDLDLVYEPFGKARADGTVHHPHGQDFLLAGWPFAFAEPAGKLPAGPELLAVIALKREEIEPRPRVGPHGRGQDGRVPVRGHDRAAREPRDLSGLEFLGAATDGPFNTDVRH